MWFSAVFRGLSRRNFGGRRTPLWHSPDPQLSYGIGFMVVGCVVSESISAQNQKKERDGRTDRPTSSKLYPSVSRGITSHQQRQDFNRSVIVQRYTHIRLNWHLQLSTISNTCTLEPVFHDTFYTARKYVYMIEHVQLFAYTNTCTSYAPNYSIFRWNGLQIGSIEHEFRTSRVHPEQIMGYHWEPSINMWLMTS